MLLLWGLWCVLLLLLPPAIVTLCAAKRIVDI
jgi:hypothetical protein